MSEKMEERLAELIEAYKSNSFNMKSADVATALTELQERRASSPVAGRDAVIEECAKVAEAGVLMFDGAPDVKLGCEMASKVMLHAIRALKGAP